MGRTAVAVSAGEFHTCALLDNATVRCWGDAELGRLGYGNTDRIGDNETPGSVGPVSFGGSRTALSVGAGGSHTCAILDDRSVRCWGNAGNGLIGYGITNNIGDDETPAAVGAVDIGSGRTAAALAAAPNHTCVRLDDGKLRCWGFGDSGRLGYANTNTIGDNETPGSIGTVDLYPPTAVNDTKTVVEDSATTIDVRANDTDPDGNFSIQSVTQPTDGQVAITNSGADLSYAPDANYCGTDSFTYTLNGGSQATVEMTVTCVDDAPVADGDTKTISEDAEATAIGVLANDTDVDDGPKTLTAKTNGTHGTATITNAGDDVTYRPDAGWCGTTPSPTRSTVAHGDRR